MLISLNYQFDCTAGSLLELFVSILEQRQVVAAEFYKFFCIVASVPAKLRELKMFRRVFVVSLMAVLPMLAVAQEKAVETDPLAQYRAEATKKWEAEIVKLEEQDRNQPDPKDGILFIGSSSIRMWSRLAN